MLQQPEMALLSNLGYLLALLEIYHVVTSGTLRKGSLIRLKASQPSMVKGKKWVGVFSLDLDCMLTLVIVS